MICIKPIFDHNLLKCLTDKALNKIFLKNKKRYHRIDAKNFISEQLTLYLKTAKIFINKSFKGILVVL